MTNKRPPGMGGMALPVVEVVIEEVTDDGRVIAIDGRTRRYELPLVMRAKGAVPVPGEVWLISRETGYWNLSGVKDRILPSVTGSRRQSAALASLLSGLAGMGLVQDSSVAGGTVTSLTSSASINGSGLASVNLPAATVPPLSGFASIDFSISANTGSTAWWDLPPSGYGWPLRSGKGRASIPWKIDATILTVLTEVDFSLEVPGASSGTASITLSYLSS